MKSVFALVALPLLLLFILNGSLPSVLPAISVKAFPATVSMVSSNTTSTTRHSKTALIDDKNKTTETSIPAGDVTEYPVFVSAAEDTQTSESEAVTENQEMDDDDDDPDSSTTSPVILGPTSPMPSPQSSPEQEEVLRELKKLWDLSEGMSDNGNDALKNSLSSIVHLAYARVYVEPDETLLKLKYLLKQLQARILLGTKLHSDDSESLSTTETATSLSPSSPSMVDSAANLNDSTNSNLPKTLTTTASLGTNQRKVERRKRSFYNGYDDNDEIDAIFFANVNSAENSVVPEDKYQYEHVPQNEPGKADFTKLDSVGSAILIANNLSSHDDDQTKKDPIDRTLLSIGSVVSSAVPFVSTSTPTTVVQKVIHINDRQKPMPSFYLTPERVQELKSRVTTSTSTTTSTLSPLNIIIEDELENEVNMLQQQNHVDNYDIHISSSSAKPLVPLTTVTPPSSSYFQKKPVSGGGSTTIMTTSASFSPSTTEMPYTAEDIALALFQLLRPETFDDDESEDEHVTELPHPKPSNILYQVSSLSSVLNFTITTKNASTSTTTTTTARTTTTATTVVPTKETTTSTTAVPLSSTIAAPTTKLTTTLSFLKLKEKYATKNNQTTNATLLVPAPTALLDLANSVRNNGTVLMSTSTERQVSPVPSNDAYDYTDVLDQTPAAADPSIAATIVQGTQEGMLQMVDSITRLSVGAKMVLLFSVSISILSIGFGIYALGPPLAGVGVLGIIIPVGLLLLFETTGGAGKRKLTTRQREQLLINKLQSEEFSKILDMLFDAVIKYSKG